MRNSDKPEGDWRDLPAPKAPAPLPGSGDWCAFGPESTPIDAPTVEPDEVDVLTDPDDLRIGEGATEVSDER
jgi:hypothetical protein